MSNLKLYSQTRLYPNLDKCEIAGFGVLKNDNVALCRMKIHEFSGGHRNITSVLKVWQIKNLSLVGKITVFKSLAFSKNFYLTFLILLPNNIIIILRN